MEQIISIGKQEYEEIIKENYFYIDKTDLIREWWEAVKALPVKYREVIHLFYYEGYATRDIAKILNRNESSVRSDLRRGREQLKKILKEAYDFE